MNIKFCLFLLVLAGKSFGQPIELRNPSFEENAPNFAYRRDSWYNCGPASETPPDIQPGAHGVDLPAVDGQQYVSMVVRDNNTNEIIGQELIKSLRKDSVYLLTMFVARSLQLGAPEKTSTRNASYATPVILKIWGGNSPCDKKQLLAETTVITNTEWVEMKLVLQPETEITHFFLEASHKTPNLFPYNGNVLIDNISLNQIP